MNKDKVNNKPFLAYIDEVYDYLEYLGYPEYIEEFKEEDVAHSLYNAMQAFYRHNQSYRMCAIGIFALTMEYQIIPSMKGKIMH